MATDHSHHYQLQQEKLTAFLDTLSQDMREKVIEMANLEHAAHDLTWPDVPYDYSQGRIKGYEEWLSRLSEQELEQELKSVAMNYAIHLHKRLERVQYYAKNPRMIPIIKEVIIEGIEERKLERAAVRGPEEFEEEWIRQRLLKREQKKEELEQQLREIRARLDSEWAQTAAEVEILKARQRIGEYESRLKLIAEDTSPSREDAQNAWRVRLEKIHDKERGGYER